MSRIYTKGVKRVSSRTYISSIACCTADLEFGVAMTCCHKVNTITDKAS